MNILNDLEVFSSAVEKAALYKKEEDEILADAPDDFLDPLVQTLLMDPVLLPSSRVTVDRQTIARWFIFMKLDNIFSNFFWKYIVNSKQLSKMVK